MSAPSIDPTFADFTQLTTCEPAILADTNTIEIPDLIILTRTMVLPTTAVRFTNLGWAHLSVVLTTNSPHLLTVTYKGRKLVDGAVLTNFSPYRIRTVDHGRSNGWRKIKPRHR